MIGAPAGFAIVDAVWNEVAVVKGVVRGYFPDLRVVVLGRYLPNLLTISSWGKGAQGVEA